MSVTGGLKPATAPRALPWLRWIGANVLQWLR